MNRNLPLFYTPHYSQQDQIGLGEENSRHAIQVLRMNKGDALQLTDGRGHFLRAEILEANKKDTQVQILETNFEKRRSPHTTIAISLLKNSNRFEWFLEKATEIGISAIQPLICKRTEREKFRHDRLQGICISAMMQSQQCWLPDLAEPLDMMAYLQHDFSHTDLFIAHCLDSEKKELNTYSFQQDRRILLIGPEGDFTSEEIETALHKGFQPVSLGPTRLRTETAGIVGAAGIVNFVRRES